MIDKQHAEAAVNSFLSDEAVSEDNWEIDLIEDLGWRFVRRNTRSNYGIVVSASGVVASLNLALDDEIELLRAML